MFTLVYNIADDSFTNSSKYHKVYKINKIHSFNMK